MGTDTSKGWRVRDRVVIALGGNALLRRGERLDVAAQRANLANAVAAIAAIAKTQQVVITHGNGPQIGLLALQAEAAGGPGATFDVLSAESEGMVGYLIEQQLANALPGRDIATLLTQVTVDPADPAFARPTKPIGPVYDELAAQRLKLERGWTMARDGMSWRRVIASPEPHRIVELTAIRALVEAGVIVVCVGGGGIPVCIDKEGAMRGVEPAVIDKDLAAAVLAIELQADRLLLLTDVPAVFDGWESAHPRPLRRTYPGALRARRFAPGSLGPKVEAACRFVERGGGTAMIGGLSEATAIVEGRAGTHVWPAGEEIIG